MRQSPCLKTAPGVTDSSAEPLPVVFLKLQRIRFRPRTVDKLVGDEARVRTQTQRSGVHTVGVCVGVFKKIILEKQSEAQVFS